MLLNCGSKETLILLWSWKVKSMKVLLNSNLLLKGIIYLSDGIEMRWEVGVMTFVREDIPVKEVFCDNVALNIEGIFVEINLRKKKWLLFGGYCNTKTNIDTFLGSLAPGTYCSI